MEIANKIWNWLDKWIPYLWGALMYLVVTGVIGAMLIAVIKWILKLLEVL